MRWKYLGIFLVFYLSVVAAHSFEDEDDEEFVGESTTQPKQKEDAPSSGHVYEDDNEEFVGRPPEREVKEVQEEKLPPIIIVQEEVPQIWYKKYRYEIIFGMITLVFLAQLYRGQKHNKDIVASWLKQNLDLFKEQFAAIGIEHSQEGEDTKLQISEGETVVRGAYIEQHSYNTFKFFATGRVNCNYCLVSFELKRRQDLVTMATLNLLWPELDKVSYEIPLSLTDPFPCIFCLVKKNNMKLVLEENKIIKDHTTQRHVEGLSDQFSVLSEYEEIVSHILNPTMINKLNNAEANYYRIELRDDPSSTSNALRLVVEVLLTRDTTLEMAQVLTRDVLKLVDLIATFKMGKGLREKVQEKRSKTLVAAQKEKREEQQEELMKKKVAKQKEKEAKLANLTPDQQRKLEEKEHRREIKRQSKKMVKMVKK